MKMRKSITGHLFLIFALLFALTGCSNSVQVAEAATVPTQALADWMRIDMSWVPNQNLDGIQVREISRQDKDRMEIAHIPVTGNKILDDGWVDLVQKQMNDFEASAASLGGNKQFAMECAVTQGEGDILSVVFAQQDSVRTSEGKPPLVTMASYNKTSGQMVNPLDRFELSGEMENELGKKLITKLSSAGIVKGNEDWLTQNLLGESDGWDQSLAMGQDVALFLDRPDNLPLVVPFAQTDVDTLSGKLKPKLVALTFDDGPIQHNTDRLLDILKQYNVKVTFFLLGKNVVVYPKTVARIHTEGHEIGNHTYNHKDLTKLTIDEAKQQINSTADAIEAACGVRPTLLRPPYGSTTYSLRDQIAAPFIKWSVEPADSFNKDTNGLVNYILENTKDGDIILLHDAHGYTVDGVSSIITGLHKQGFKFVTVTELLTRNGDTLKNGESYRYCRSKDAQEVSGS